MPQPQGQMTATKFKPTHIMSQIGKVDVPVIIFEKRNALWLVIDQNCNHYWVGKYNVEEIN